MAYFVTAAHTQPAANYLCVEPWQGFPAPEGFDGELADKPGILHLSPKQSEQFGMSITVVEKPLRDAIKL